MTAHLRDTIAEHIALGLDHDGTRWESRDGNWTFEQLVGVESHVIDTNAERGLTRLRFPDGSVITYGKTWGVGFVGCWCVEGDLDPRCNDHTAPETP